MIEPIVIKVVDKVPIVASGPQYVVCDNSDYTVVWQLDEEWAQLEHRTMQVNYKDGTYERVLFTGDTCALPAIPVKDWFYIGLFAGDIHTTRPAKLFANRAITTDSGEERDPMPNGYAQAIEALDAKLDKNQGADNAGKALVVGDDGNVVPGDVQGGGSLPVASPTQLGGVKPVAKTDTMTQSIGVDGNGGLYVEPAEVYYIDLEGTYPNYTCPVAMADIKAAYEAGKVLECRCALGQYTATLPLFIPMPSANTWIFSGSGALIAMNFPAQTLTIAIANNTVKASGERLARMIDKLPNPNDLIFTGAVDASYDGSKSITVNIPTIPTALKNPNALTVKVGSTTTTYDGSSAKTVEIANGSDGLSPSEKNLILTLFESLPYTEDVSLTVSSLKKLWNGTAVYYPVTYNLTDVTAKNPVASVIEGGTLEVELEPDDGTEISSVSVTMSGTDITAAVYSAGRITIPSVSGAVVIAAVSAAAGFTPLEYLEGDGTAWINTGYSPSTQDLVEIKFAPTATAWDYVFSMYASSKATYGLRLRAAYSGTGTSFTRRGGGSNAELNDGVAFDWVYNTVYVLKETSPGTATIHNESGESLLTISDPQVGNFAEPTNPIFLWIRSNGTAPYGRVACEERIYSFKVVDAYGNAKLDLIPVLDGDGVACMYDKVSKRFLHDGTGGNTFIAGGQQ